MLCTDCGAPITDTFLAESGTGVYAPDGYQERVTETVYACERGHINTEAIEEKEEVIP